MSERVFIIGAGKVGRGLARAFRLSGIEVVGVHARRESEYATSAGELPASIADANVIIIAVSDSEIENVGNALANAIYADPKKIRRGTVILHTSGTVDPQAFQLLRSLGMVAGTFHPLVAFSSPERGAELLRSSWIGIDGEGTAMSTSRRLAGAIGARTVNIPAGGKAAYHAAAVIASNFPVVLAAVASEILIKRGIPKRSAEQVVQSLMSGAVDNLQFGSPVDVLTGPAARGDARMIESHKGALVGDAAASQLYSLLTSIALELVDKRR